MNDINNIMNDIMNNINDIMNHIVYDITDMSYIIEQICHKPHGLLVDPSVFTVVPYSNVKEKFRDFKRDFKGPFSQTLYVISTTFEMGCMVTNVTDHT